MAWRSSRLLFAGRSICAVNMARRQTEPSRIVFGLIDVSPERIAMRHVSCETGETWTRIERESPATYWEENAILGRRDNGNGAPIGEPPPGGEDDDVLPF